MRAASRTRSTPWRSRAAIREPDLPEAHLDGAARELRLLVDHRDDLVCERTRIQNRLRWHLHETDPDLEPPARTLGRLAQLERLGRRLARRQQTVHGCGSPASSSVAAAS